MSQEIVNAFRAKHDEQVKLRADYVAYALSIGCHPMEFDRIGPATPEQEAKLAAWWIERTGMPTIKSNGVIL